MNSHENASQTEERKRLLFLSTHSKAIKTWTKEEDKILLKKAKEHNYKNWKEVASFLPGRIDIQCSARYKRIKPGIVKGTWTAEEDNNLINLLKTFGKNWSLISKYMPSRSGKQIRDRYLNTLDPCIKRDKFSKEEDMKIIEAYLKNGPAWSKISKNFKGRTGDMIKNRFYSSLKRKINKKEILVEDGFVVDMQSDKESEEMEQSLRKKKKPDENLLNKKQLRPRITSQAKMIKTEDNAEIKEEFDPNTFNENKNSSTLIQNNIQVLNNQVADPLMMDEQINQLIGNLVENNIINILKREELEYQLQLLNQLLQLTYAKLEQTKQIPEVNETPNGTNNSHSFHGLINPFDRRPMAPFNNILTNPLSHLNGIGNPFLNAMNNNFNLNYRQDDKQN
jgi:hypothetical protein